MMIAFPQIKACMDAADCQPDFCLDIFDQNGNGKRKIFAVQLNNFHEGIGSMKLNFVEQEKASEMSFESSQVFVILKDYFIC